MERDENGQAWGNKGHLEGTGDPPGWGWVEHEFDFGHFKKLLICVTYDRERLSVALPAGPGSGELQSPLGSPQLSFRTMVMRNRLHPRAAGCRFWGGLRAEALKPDCVAAGSFPSVTRGTGYFNLPGTCDMIHRMPGTESKLRCFLT